MPGLRVGFLISFVGPLVFVLGVTLVKEFLDDHARSKKDSQINNKQYLTVKLGGGLLKKTAAKNLKVGDIVVLNSNEAAPADLCLLWTSDAQESIFIRTDQLDGETDWKVRRPL